MRESTRIGRLRTGVQWLGPWLGLLLGTTAVIADSEAWDDWQVPGVRELKETSWAWCRAYVQVPDAWTRSEGLLAESVTLILEGVTDACEVYLNGELIGRAGTFPPHVQSAREEVHRLKVPPGRLQPGRYNVLTLKLYAADHRVGFLGRAPVLAGYHDECRLDGTWQIRPGEEPPVAVPVDARPARAVFDQITRATSPLRRPERLNPGRHLPPAESLARITVADDLAVDLVLSEPEIAQPLSLDFDAQGRMWVVEYRQYPFPAGLTMVSRDKYYRAAYDRVPLPPPRHTPGQDRISVHSDADGDGTFETHTVFLDGLNLVTSLELGQDGVWVLNPPYLLFYPDRNHDAVPDGEPEVHLKGFGLEDTHSLANSLTWGPDGWLYGAQGSTTSSRVEVVGQPGPAVYRDGAMIWRYHPPSRRYEVFAEGGGNAFGIELDAQGRLYSGHNGGNTRGFYYVQGGYYQKGTDGKYGPLSNPHAFGLLPPMPHGEVPRFSHDLIKYEGIGLPTAYRGKLFSIDPLQQQVVVSDIEPDGAAFRTRDLSVGLATTDLAFRPVDIATGPDGAVYIADFCEEFIAHGQHFQGQIDPSTGRVYRLRARQPVGHGPPAPVRWSDATLPELLKLLESDDRWTRQMARRCLPRPSDPVTRAALETRLQESHGQLALESLWALHLGDAWSDSVALRAMTHPNAHVRRWAVRLIGDRREAAPSVAQQLAQLAMAEPDAEVRGQLAATAARLPTSVAMPILLGLVQHDSDRQDPYLPRLLWWALESHADHDDAVMSLWTDAQTWQAPLAREAWLTPLMRRYAGGTRADLRHCARLLELAPDSASRELLLAGFEQAFAGRTALDLPEPLVRALEAAGGGSLALRVRRGDPAAIAQAVGVLRDPAAAVATRVEYARLLGEIDDVSIAPILLNVLVAADRVELTRACLVALQGIDQAEIAATVLSCRVKWPPQLREDADRLLASRLNWARSLIEALDAGRVVAADLPDDVVQRLAMHAADDVQAAVGRHWGDRSLGLDLERQRDLARANAALAGGEADPYRGKALFSEHCAKCHQLFREGGQIGPDLTTYQRSDTARLVLQVALPDLEVREGFETWLAQTDDGRVVNGFLLDQDASTVVLRGADGQNVTLARARIEQLQRTPQSLMPSGLLHTLTDQQIRDLFAYLRLSQPLNE